MTTIRARILDALRKSTRGLTAHQIAERINVPVRNVMNACWQMRYEGAIDIAGFGDRISKRGGRPAIYKLPSAKRAVGASGASTGLCVSSLFNSEGPAGSGDCAPPVTTVAVNRGDPSARSFSNREREFAAAMNGRRYTDDPRSLAERHGIFRAPTTYVGGCGSAAAMCVGLAR